MQPISRRGLLGKGAAGAAVIAASAVLPATTPPTNPRPSCPCNPPRPMMGVDREKDKAAWQVLMTSGPEVKTAAMAYDTQHGNNWMAEYQLMVDAFAAHFPGLAPAIQQIALHVIDESVITQSCACFGESA